MGTDITQPSLPQARPHPQSSSATNMAHSNAATTTTSNTDTTDANANSTDATNANTARNGSSEFHSNSQAARSDHCKVKVHTWLNNKDYNKPLKDHAPLNNQVPLHVHFADEETSEDTKSTSSSHTSGIVTDFPASPKLFLSCCCPQCSDFEGSFTHPHLDVNSKLSMPSALSRGSGGESCMSMSSSSTQCHSAASIGTKAAPTEHFHTTDTVIDEPLLLTPVTLVHESRAVSSRTTKVPISRAPLATYV